MSFLSVGECKDELACACVHMDVYAHVYGGMFIPIAVYFLRMVVYANVFMRVRSSVYLCIRARTYRRAYACVYRHGFLCISVYMCACK